MHRMMVVLCDCIECFCVFLFFVCVVFFFFFFVCFFFQAEDGIRDLVRSRGLGDVYKRQGFGHRDGADHLAADHFWQVLFLELRAAVIDDVRRDDLSLIHI